jgi:serine/threonine protein kinase/WD40 repeat protein
VTSASRHCSECGAALPADAPRGACPRCLLRRGFEPRATGEPADPRATVHLVLAEEADTALPFSEMGDYEVFKEIGRGGMGVIYQARQRSLGRIVALKLIRAGTLAKADGLARFKLEAAATARLHHPGIVAIHEVGEHEGQHFYSMDFVPGRSLATTLRDGPLAPRRAAQCVRAVADAIHHAHEHGIIHRDLKPSNILLDAEGTPRVSDFGLAKLVVPPLGGQSPTEPPSAGTTNDLTLSGQVLGSPNYMPPEQARGRHAEVDVRSDVYALGAILYECLTGRPPFSAATPLETLRLVVEQEPVSPRVLNPALPRDLETIALKCLAKEPSTRYASARELAEELGRFLADAPIRARPAGSAERAWRWCRRQPALAGLYFVLAVAPAIIITLLMVMGSRVSHQRDRAIIEERKASAAAIRAEASALAAREQAYAADIYAAHQALTVDDFGQARRLLNEHRPHGMTNGEWRMMNARTSPAGITHHASRNTGDLRGFEWRLLWQRTRGQEAFAFTNLARPAQCLLFAPDGRTLLSGSEDGIRLWDIVERRPLGVFPSANPIPTRSDRALTVEDLRPLLDASPAVVEYLRAQPGILDYLDAIGHTNRARGVTSLAFTPDKQSLLVGSTDLVRSWNYATRAFEFAVPERSANVAMPAVGDLFVVGNRETWGADDARRSAHPRSATVYSFSRRQMVAELPDYGRQIAVSPDGQYIAAVNQTNGAVLWRPGTGETVSLSRDRHSDVTPAFSPDGRLLFLGSDLGPPAMLWDVASKRLLAYLQGGNVTIGAVAWSPDGRTLAGGGGHQNIGLWSVPLAGSERGVEAGTRLIGPRLVLHGHEAPVLALTFSPDGRSLISSSSDHSIRLWDVEAALATVAAAASVSPQRAMHEFAMDPATGCLVGRMGRDLALWDPQRDYAMHSLPGTARQFHAGFLAHGGGFITVELTTNDTPTHVMIRRLPDGLVQSQREIGPVPKEIEPDDSDSRPVVAASPNGQWLVVRRSIGTKSYAYAYEVGTGRFVTQLRASQPGVYALRFSPDGRWLIVTQWKSGQNSIAVFDTTTWRLAREMRFDSAGEDVRVAAIDPTGRFLVTGGGNQNSLRVWELESGRLLGRCNGAIHQREPVWSPDSRTLVVGGGHLRLWSMVVFRELASVPLPGILTPLGFTANGCALVNINGDGRVHLVSPPTLSEIDGGQTP